MEGSLENLSLDDAEIQTLSNIIYSLSNIKQRCQLDDLVKFELPKLIRHESAIFGLLDINTETPLCVFNYNFPEKLERGVFFVNNKRSCPLTTKSLQEKAPQYICKSFLTNHELATPWGMEFTKSSVDDFTLHTQTEITGTLMSVFGFTNTTSNTLSHTNALMRLLVPYLHVIITQVYNYDKGARIFQNPLTPRESEILKWVGKGKTNYEISRILSISSWTVKNHISNIISKLEVTNRAQALHKASNLGYIKEEVTL